MFPCTSEGPILRCLLPPTTQFHMIVVVFISQMRRCICVFPRIIYYEIPRWAVPLRVIRRCGINHIFFRCLSIALYLITLTKSQLTGLWGESVMMRIHTYLHTMYTYILCPHNVLLGFFDNPLYFKCVSELKGLFYIDDIITIISIVTLH